MVDRRDTGGDGGEVDGTGDGPHPNGDETEDLSGIGGGPEDGTRPAEPPDDEQAADDGDDMSGIFGPRDEPREIVPGNPDPENALFVLLGVLVGVASLLELVGAL